MSTHNIGFYEYLTLFQRKCQTVLYYLHCKFSRVMKDPTFFVCEQQTCRKAVHLHRLIRVFVVCFLDSVIPKIKPLASNCS